MGEEKPKQQGGFNIGSVGGDAKFEAGGDIVAGDKVAGDKVAGDKNTTTNNGFQKQADKDEFLKQIDEIRAGMRDIKAQIEQLDELDEDKKDEVVSKVLDQVRDLKGAKETAVAIPVGQAPSADGSNMIEKCLGTTKNVLDGIGEIGEKVAPIVGKLLPILASARHLFGLP